MRAKLDESMPNEAAEALRTAGWECDTVHDEGLSGADDASVAVVALLVRCSALLDRERAICEAVRG